MQPVPALSHDLPTLSPRTIEDAKAATPGYDIYLLQQDRRVWWASSGKPKIDNSPAAFIGFCASQNKRARMRLVQGRRQ
jgi:hypothetical protein